MVSPTNPYPDGTEKAEKWNDGYSDAAVDYCSDPA